MVLVIDIFKNNSKKIKSLPDKLLKFFFLSSVVKIVFKLAYFLDKIMCIFMLKKKLVVDNSLLAFWSFYWKLFFFSCLQKKLTLNQVVVSVYSSSVLNQRFFFFFNFLNKNKGSLSVGSVLKKFKLFVKNLRNSTRGFLFFLKFSVKLLTFFLTSSVIDKTLLPFFFFLGFVKKMFFFLICFLSIFFFLFFFFVFFFFFSCFFFFPFNFKNYK